MKNKQYCTSCDQVSTNKEIELSGDICPRCSAPNESLIPVDDASLKHTAALVRHALELEGKILVAKQFDKWVGFQRQVDPNYNPTSTDLNTWLVDNGYWTGENSRVEENYLESIWNMTETMHIDYSEPVSASKKLATEQENIMNLLNL